MIDTNAFYKFSETRGTSGYRGAVLVKDPFNTVTDKYSLLVASTTIPSIFGSTNKFEIDLLNSSSISSIEGKPSSEAKDVEILHHRDNAFRFHRLVGRTLEFMTINGELMGYKFTGTVNYRPNDASNDVWTATYTITPMSGDMTPVYYAGDEIAETLCFNSVVPVFAKVGDTINLSVAQTNATVKYEMFSINSKTGAVTETYTELTKTGTGTGYVIPSQTADNKPVTGLYGIRVSDPLNVYASWITTIYIDSTL